jgi:hypothetical protein
MTTASTVSRGAVPGAASLSNPRDRPGPACVLAASVVAVAGLAAGLVMPRGPVTTLHSLAEMVPPSWSGSWRAG